VIWIFRVLELLILLGIYACAAGIARAVQKIEQHQNVMSLWYLKNDSETHDLSD